MRIVWISYGDILMQLVSGYPNTCIFRELYYVFIIYRNMPVYYTGLNASPLFSNQNGIITSIAHLTQIPFAGVTDIEISWNYFLLWQDTKLYITGKISDNDIKNNPRLIQIPEESSGR